MSQHDLDIANQTASNARADINLALKALGSLNSGSSAPATTYANMLWYDTTNNTLKMRSEANDAWISVGYLDQGSDAFRIFDDTQVVNSSGTQTGLIGDQATSAWEAGTSTTESLVSPAKVAAAISALASNVPDDGSVTEAKLASSAVSNPKLKTSTRSFSGTVIDSSPVNISLSDDFAFAPRCSGSTQVDFNFYSGGYRITTSSDTSQSYSITWKYVTT